MNEIKYDYGIFSSPIFNPYYHGCHLGNTSAKEVMFLTQLCVYVCVDMFLCVLAGLLKTLLMDFL